MTNRHQSFTIWLVVGASAHSGANYEPNRGLPTRRTQPDDTGIGILVPAQAAPNLQRLQPHMNGYIMPWSTERILARWWNQA
jgi:hypothetical protein